MYKFHEEKDQYATIFRNKKKMQGNKFYEQNQHATSFTRKLSQQQVPWARSVSQEEKSMCDFHDKKINMWRVSWIKIKTQQLPRTKISMQWVPWVTSVLRGEKSMQKLHEEKYQHAISFTNEKEHVTISRKKIQIATSSMNRISFTRRKINAQVSWREKRTCKHFHEQ